jgi:hypothetical protein
MLYRPPRVRGLLFGGLLTAWAGGLAVALLVRAATLDVELALVLCLIGAALLAGLAVLFGYWTYATAELRYIVDRNALAIQWGGVRQLVPLRAIDRLIPGRNVPEPEITGIDAPGLHFGRGSVERVGDTLFYSTHTNRDQVLYIVTATQSYGLTVEDPAAFAQAIQDRQGKEVVSTRQAPLRTSLAGQGFWFDPAAYVLVGLALTAGLSLAAYVFWSYPGLPLSMEIPFPPMDEVVRIGSRRDVLQVPLTALAILGINVAGGFIVYQAERMAAYLLWAAAVGLQVLFWVAAGRTLF